MKVFCLSLFQLCNTICAAQNLSMDIPIVGKPLPDFTLTNVQYYSKGSFTIQENKGKWVIMDFWSQGCAACVQGFPKVNQLQKEFKETIQFLLVANNDRVNKNTKHIYEKYRQKLGLSIAIAYDSSLFKRFGITSVPHIIILDPEGRVYAITIGSELNSSNLLALTENRSPRFKPKSSAYDTSKKKESPIWKYYVQNIKEVQDDFLYRSILSKSNGEQQLGDFDVSDPRLFQTCKTTLPKLYMVAYGWYKNSLPYQSEFWCDAVVEITDSGAYQLRNGSHDGYYNYSLLISGENTSKEYLRKIMQNDLKNYFGYEVSIESRIMPYWKLTTTQEGQINLKSKVDRQGYHFKAGPTGIDGKRITIQSILGQIYYYGANGALPVVDETNIKGYIDISFEAVMTNMEDLIDELSKHGLKLETSMKQMKVFIIKDVEKANKQD